MPEYDFALRFKLPEEAPDPELHVGALLRAGCDDATIGVGRLGKIALEFTRGGRTAHAAMKSAIRDVTRAIPDAELIEVAPDYVGVTEIAAALGVSRQAARKMIEKQVGFPDPVHEGASALFRLALVLDWCARQAERDIDAMQFEVAKAAMRHNFAIEGARVAMV